MRGYSFRRVKRFGIPGMSGWLHIQLPNGDLAASWHLLGVLIEMVPLWTLTLGILIGAASSRFLLHRKLQAQPSPTPRGTDEQHLFQVLMEQTTDAIFLHDDSGRILQVNEQACKSLGYSRADLLRINVCELDGDYSLEQAKRIWSTMDQDRPMTLYGRHLHRDGHFFPVEVRVQRFEHEGHPLYLAVARDITSRQKTEREARLGSFVLEKTSIGFLLMDWEGNVLRINSAAQCMLQWPSLVLNSAHFDNLGLDFPGGKWSQIQEKLQNCPALTLEGNCIVQGASSFPAELQLNRLEFEKQQHVLAFINDRTQQRSTELALRLSENRLRAIFDSEPECVKLLDGNGTLLEMNPAGLKLVEADQESEVIGQLVADLVVEEDREAFIRVNRDAFEGKSGQLEFRLTGLKGSVRWLETHVTPLLDGDGNVVAALSVTRDIDERKRNEENTMQLLQGTSAKSGDEYFEALIGAIARTLKVEFACIGELELNLETGRVDRVRTLCAMKGGRFLNTFEYLLENTPCANAITGDFCFYGRDVQKIFPKDVALVEMEAESYLGLPLKSRDGEPIGLLFVVDTRPMAHDPKQEALFRIFAERAGMELSRIIATRNQKILEAELRHAQKMETIGTLAGGIAHDFNNILAIILANTEIMISEEIENSLNHESLMEVRKATLRAKSLVNQILTFSRKNGGQQEIMELPPIILETAGMLRSTLSKNVSISTQLCENPPRILGDPDQIHQILLNLCTNAAQAIGLGPGEIIIKLETCSPPRQGFQNQPDTRTTHGFGCPYWITEQACPKPSRLGSSILSSPPKVQDREQALDWPSWMASCDLIKEQLRWNPFLKMAPRSAFCSPPPARYPKWTGNPATLRLRIKPPVAFCSSMMKPPWSRRPNACWNAPGSIAWDSPTLSWDWKPSCPHPMLSKRW